MKKIEKQILDIIYNALGLEINRQHIDEGVTIKNLGISSMEVITLIFEFEEAFDIDIETEEMFTLQSVNDVTAFINKKVTVKNQLA